MRKILVVMKQMRIRAEQNNATLVAEITEQNMELNMTIDALRNDLRTDAKKSSSWNWRWIRKKIN